MPVFKYQAVDQAGRNLRGTLTADNESILERKLKEAGLWLTDASLHSIGTANAETAVQNLQRLKLKGRRGRRELIDFCTLMIFQTKVGITLVRALDVACQDCKDNRFREVLRDLQRQIESGRQLSEALAMYPGVFSMHFVSVIRAGELSGKLSESFSDLRDYLEWLDEVSAAVRQSSLYPAIVSVVVLSFTIFLFTFVIPRFANLLDSLNVQQPLLTRIVFGIGNVAKATWWIWVLALLVLVIGIPTGRRISPRFNFMMDRLKLRWPIFGSLNLMLSLSRFAHNLAILYRSGLPIVRALQACQQGLIGNAVVEQAVKGVEEDVKSGSIISQAMHRHPVFPPLLLRMVGMGETTGNLDAALENVCNYYNDVIPRRIKTIFSIVEPMLIVFLVFLVGCVALAIYLPIIALMGSIH